MASWDRKFTGGSYANNWWTRLDYWEDGKSGNSTLIRLRMYIRGDPGYSQTGLWVPRGRGSWMGEYGGNFNGTIGSSWHQVASWDGWVGHDANGNLYVTVGTYVNAPVNDMNWSDIGWQLSRIALAPSIAGVAANQIKPTSARIGVEVNNNGHGTSTSMRMYYRLQGAASWTQTGNQNDAVGYNYWTVTGLKPGKTYEYFARVWNNNGDSRDSSVSTFKTKGVASALPLIAAVGM